MSGLNHSEIAAGLSAEERAEIAATYLEGLEPGRQPLKLFTQLSRLTVLSTIELVGVRCSNGETEALVTQRGANEPFWPNLVHTPGCAVLASDPLDNYHDISGTTDRVLAELRGGIEVVGNVAHFLELRRSRNVERGDELSPILWAEVKVVDEEQLAASRGRFLTRAAMGEIPSDLLHDVHRNQLDRAMNAFEAPPLEYPANTYVLDYRI